MEEREQVKYQSATRANQTTQGTGRAPRGLGEIAGDRAASLVMLTESIGQRINQIADRQDAAEQAIHRLLSPRPQSARDPGGLEKNVSVCTHENQLEQLIRRLDVILETADRHAGLLNSAV